MNPHLTERVEKILKLADEIAREYEIDYIGTEHILLAIRKEGTGVASAVLKDRGISFEGVKKVVDGLIKKSLEDTWVFGRLPGSPHFRNVIAQAVEQAKAMNSKEVCAEHLLLALMSERDSVAHQTLKELGFSLDELRDEIVKQSA
ncbi:MAG TPA: Clp protease N-terminal domain-containing protein [Phycisphaerae bacterium]|nr:Clp protease N-terminal domain-containing protein [Phycisphaerae bacterium]